MVTNDLSITIRDAIHFATGDRGRIYDVEHEAHDMALMVIRALAGGGYTIVKQTEQV